jgi:hypothetical protein
MHEKVWWENRKERGLLEARDVDGQRTLKFITEGVYGTHLKREGSKWWALLNTVMKY